MSEYEFFGASTGGGGLVQDMHGAMSFEDYRSIDALNNSLINHLAKSPAHFKHELEHPTERTSDALRFGTLAHAGVLERERLSERYAIIPPYEDVISAVVPRSTNSYKAKVAEFRESVSPREAVTQEQWDRMEGVCTSIDACEPARLAFREGKPEQTLIWRDPDHHIWCKARPDFVKIGAGMLCDLKTTRDASDFGRAVAMYGYDRQAAWYLRGARALGIDATTFFFVAVESTAPYGVTAAPLDPETLADGEAQIRHLLNVFARCMVTDEWPGYEQPETFAKPDWSFKFKREQKRMMTIGGTQIEI